MKHLIKKNKKVASLLAFVLAFGLLSVPVSASELPAEVPAAPAAEQSAAIPEPVDIYVNGDNRVFTLSGELSALFRLHVSDPGRVHVLTSGVDVSVVLFNESAGEVCGVYNSVNGVMDAPFDAYPGTYLLGFSGWGEAAVLVADEAAASAILSEAGVVSASPAASSKEAPAEETMKEAPAPIACRADLHQTVYVASVLRDAGASVNLVKWVSGEMEGRLVRAEVNGDWLLTPYVYFNNLELTVLASDGKEDTLYTIIFSCPDPSAQEQQATTSEGDSSEAPSSDASEAPAEGTAEAPENTDASAEGTADVTETTDASADGTDETSENTETPSEETDEVTETTEAPTEGTDETSENTETPAEGTDETSEITETPAEGTDEATETTDATAEETDEDSEAAEASAEGIDEAAETTETPNVFDPSAPITRQINHRETVSVLSIMTEAGAPVNVITHLSGETEGKVAYVNQNHDWLLTPFNYFDSLELSVTATDYLAPDPEAASTVYTVILSNPDPASVPAAEGSEADASAETTDDSVKSDPAELVVTITMERADGNLIRLSPVDLSPDAEEVYTYQWQISMDNEQWTNVEGATSRDYTFTLDETIVNSYWRLVITEKEFTE